MTEKVPHGPAAGRTERGEAPVGDADRLGAGRVRRLVGRGELEGDELERPGRPRGVGPCRLPGERPDERTALDVGRHPLRAGHENEAGEGLARLRRPKGPGPEVARSGKAAGAGHLAIMVDGPEAPRLLGISGCGRAPRPAPPRARPRPWRGAGTRRSGTRR